MEYTTLWTYSVGTKQNSKPFLPNRYTLYDHGQGLYLRTNQIKQICELITYMKQVFGSYNSEIAPQDDPFHPFALDELSQQTPNQMRTFLIQHLLDPHGPSPVPSGPISSSRPTGYSTAAIELMGFKKGEIATYPSLKDERYFDGFKRSLFIAKSHKCNEVLDPMVKVDCYLVDLVVQRANQLELYISYLQSQVFKSSSFQISSFQVFNFQVSCFQVYFQARHLAQRQFCPIGPQDVTIQKEGG